MAVFLRAEWRRLAMLNYEVDPAVLQRRVPAGTTLDSFAGKTYVSVVGFMALSGPPRSAFLAEGSPVTVHGGIRIAR